MKIRLFCILFYFCSFHSAHGTLTTLPKTSEEVLTLLQNNFYTPEINDLCRLGLQYMFNEDLSSFFSSPPHSTEVLLKGWNCFLEKMRRASDKEEQRIILGNFFALHQKTFLTINDPEILALILESNPCENCLKFTKKNYTTLQ